MSLKVERAAAVGTHSIHDTFHSRRRRQYLALLGLQDKDHQLVARLQREVIAPHADAIIDELFLRLLANGEAAAALRRADIDLDAIKTRQRDALLRFGVDFGSAAYFADRLRLGLAFAQRGIPVAIYQAAHACLQALILARIPLTCRQKQGQGAFSYDALAALVIRIGALDLSIALDAYHELEIDGWQASLQAVRDEGRKWQLQVGRDSLTELADHGHIIDLLCRALKRARADGHAVSIIMADIDYFKGVNDTHGHLVGDHALSETATRIVSAVRDGDAVGRYGGDEFLIVLENTSIETAKHIAQRVRARVGQDPVEVDGKGIDITLSEGVAMAQVDDTGETLIARADAQLYHAKAAGRNRVSAEPTRALACCAHH